MGRRHPVDMDVFSLKTLGSHPENGRRRSDDLLCVVDDVGQLGMLNEAWERMLGWAPSELEGTQAAMLLHPDDLPRLLAIQRSARLDGRFEDVEARCRTADGGYRWLLCSGFRGDGVWHGTARDIGMSGPGGELIPAGRSKP